MPPIHMVGPKKPIRNHGLMVLLAIVVFAVSIAFWRAAVTEGRLTLASQVDREDAELCIRFGFRGWYRKARRLQARTARSTTQP